MKKVLAFLLVLVMMFCVVACCEGEETNNGGNGGNGGNTSQSGGNNKGDDYKAAINLFMDVKYKGNEGAIESLAPEAYWAFYETGSGMTRGSMIDEIKYAVKESYESCKYAYGDDFTLTIDFTGETKVSANDLEKITAAFDEQKGIDKSKIGSAYTIDVKLTFSGTETVEEQIQVSVIKVDKTWYCAEWMIWDEGTYATFLIESMAFVG